MTVGHYENFPVASCLLPRRLRWPVSVIYRFARSADDLADEGTSSAEQRLDALEQYRYELQSIEAGRPSHSKLFIDLAAVVEQYQLDLQAFYDLLSAFSQDVTTMRYANYPALLDYCRRSANPVGRLMLKLYRQESEDNLACSDRICTALQLINFWQDVAIDRRKQRTYIPQDELQRFRLSDEDIDLGMNTSKQTQWRELMRAQMAYARTMMLAGAPLAARLPGRIGFELRVVVQGGLRILEKIEQVDYDVFNRRPVLTPIDWLVMFKRALWWRHGSGTGSHA